MANKIVSLLLQVKNKLSPGVKEAATDMSALEARAADLQRELKKLENAKAAAEGLAAARDAAKAAEEEFDKAQIKVEELKIALRSEKTPELATALIKARDTAREAKSEWKDSEKEVKRLETTITKAGGSLDHMAETQSSLATEISKTNGAIKRNAEELGNSQKSMNAAAESGERVGFSFKEIAIKAAALIGVVAIVDKLRSGLGSLARSVWETGNQFEQFSARLNADEFGYIEEFVKTTPQGLDDVADAFLRLKSFGMDPMDGTLQALIDKNAQLGGNMESLQGIILQLGQGWTKHKMQAEDIVPLLERGIPVYDLLGEAMGKTAAEIQTLASEGKLGRKEIQLLIDAMGASAVGEAGKQMSMMTGIVATLKSQFTNFYKEIADAGAWDYLKGQLTDLSAYIKRLSASGELQRMAKAFSDGFITMAETVKSTVVTIYELRGVLGLLAQAWLALKVASWVGQLGSAAKGFIGIGTDATTAATAFRALAVAMKATIGMAIVQGIWEVANAYKTLQIEVQKLDQAKRAEAASSAELAERFRKISEETGVTVRNMRELDAAIAAGTIVIDEQAGSYLSAEQAAKKFAAEQESMSFEAQAAALGNERLQNAVTALNTVLTESEGDAKKLATALSTELVAALEGGKFGAEEITSAIASIGFNNDEVAKKLDDGLKTALESLNDEQLTQFGEEIKRAMENAANGGAVAETKLKQLQKMLDTVTTTKLERAFKTLGITSQAELAKIAASAEDAFAQVVASGAPLEDQKNAFIAYAKAAVDANKGVSTSQQQIVLDQLKTTAATLGMKDQLLELLGVQQQVGNEGRESGSEIRKGAQEGAEGIKNLRDATEEAGGSVGGLGNALANLLAGARNQMLELSEATAALFDQKMGLNTGGVVTDIEALKASIAATKNELGEMYLTASKADFTGIGQFISKVNQAHHTSKIAYQEQKLEAMKMVEALGSAGTVTQQTITNAASAMGRLKLLGQEDLSTLRSALDSANSKLQAMNDNAKSTLDNLKNELDRLQENQDAIDKRDYENKKAQLQQALDEARKMGNQQAIQSYTESLKVLEQVRQERAKQNQAAAAEKAQRDRDSKLPQQTKSTAESNKKVDINLNLGGKKASFTAGSESDANRLLEILEQAGLHTL